MIMAITAAVRMDGVSAALSSVRKMDAEFRKAARDVADKIATEETDSIKRAARTRLQRLAAQSIRVRRGAAPAIAAGGALRVTTADGRAVRGADVFFGAEYGGGSRPTTRQFPEHRGRQGYFFWPTIRNDQDQVLDNWVSALDQLAETWDN